MERLNRPADAVSAMVEDAALEVNLREESVAEAAPDIIIPVPLHTSEYVSTRQHRSA